MHNADLPNKKRALIFDKDISEFKMLHADHDTKSQLLGVAEK